MDTELLPTAPEAFSENDWDALLASLQEGQVIPIIGPELSIVTDPATGGTMPYEQWLAAALAKKIRIDVPADSSLEIVVSAAVQARYKTKDLYPQILTLWKSQPFAPPQPLLDLAAIADFKLYVTTTFDGLLARAIAAARPGVVADELAYAPKRIDDLPAALTALPRPVVYQLFGKVSTLPNFAICDEDILEWIAALQSGTYTPERLAGELENHHLLLIGVNYRDWLARFFMRATKRRRLAEDRDRHEYVADPMAGSDPRLLAFLRTHSRSTVVVNGQGGAAQFVATLRARWDAARGVTSPPAGRGGAAGPVRFLPPEIEMPPGAVFISYSRTEIEAAKTIKSGLDTVNVVTWFDLNRLEKGDDYEKKIQANIRNCSYFIPIISAGTLRRDEAFFWKEWRWAEQRLEGMARGAIFILPVIIDDTSPQHPRIPEEFRARDMFVLPGGQTTPEFLERVRRLTSGGAA